MTTSQQNTLLPKLPSQIYSWSKTVFYLPWKDCYVGCAHTHSRVDYSSVNKCTGKHYLMTYGLAIGQV